MGYFNLFEKIENDIKGSTTSLKQKALRKQRKKEKIQFSLTDNVDKFTAWVISQLLG